jgi:triosephosphate isomerase (TIM)
MRKKIAAANWKMNLTLEQGAALLKGITAANISFAPHQQAVFAVPFPYLAMAGEQLAGRTNYFVAAQNCYSKKSGAYTGETSVEMLASLGVTHVVLGHSERREYFHESHAFLAEKVNTVLEAGLTPIFCCGEPLAIREAVTQNAYVETQLRESLFHLSPEAMEKLVIAYEPIWAIGTGQTATTAQAQEMHAYLRGVIAARYGDAVAQTIPVLYGGSVKAGNAQELFSCADVDGGLVGGASLVAADFITIMQSLP